LTQKKTKQKKEAGKMNGDERCLNKKVKGKEGGSVNGNEKNYFKRR
jgi:hypothetical protein